MESFKSIRERFQGSAQRSARVTKPSLESEIPATLGGANAEPESLKRPAPVDVAALLDDAAEQSGRPLDWRNSAEDLLRALGVVSGLAEREALAEELGWPEYREWGKHCLVSRYLFTSPTSLFPSPHILFSFARVSGSIFVRWAKTLLPQMRQVFLSNAIDSGWSYPVLYWRHALVRI